MAARAQSSSCWGVPPPTPQAPMSSSPLKIGTAPCPIMKRPPYCSCSDWKVGLVDRSSSSPLGCPNMTEQTAFPRLPSTARINAPSILCVVTKLLPESTTDTAILIPIFSAWDIAVLQISKASASVTSAMLFPFLCTVPLGARADVDIFRRENAPNPA